MTLLVDRHPRKNNQLEAVITWLSSIGFCVTRGDLYRPSWSPGIWHDGGSLVVSEEAHPGDLLHEAGHAAVVPESFRKYLTFDVEEDLSPHAENYVLTHGPMDPVVQGLMQAGDSEAISWSYAAAMAVGIDPWLVFANGFGEHEEAEACYESHKAGCSFGIQGLVAAGFLNSKIDYPKLKRWL